jgi:hypothetical protein
MHAVRSLSLFVVVPIWLAAGCTGEGSNLCEENGVTVDIQDNHPDGDHQLDVPVSDVIAGVDVTYDIQGDNTGHGHDVTLTSDDFADLQDGLEVTVESTDTGAAGQDHTHTVVLTCNP